MSRIKPKDQWSQSVIVTRNYEELEDENCVQFEMLVGGEGGDLLNIGKVKVSWPILTYLFAPNPNMREAMERELAQINMDFGAG